MWGIFNRRVRQGSIEIRVDREQGSRKYPRVGNAGPRRGRRLELACIGVARHSEHATVFPGLAAPDLMAARFQLRKNFWFESVLGSDDSELGKSRVERTRHVEAVDRWVIDRELQVTQGIGVRPAR